MGRPGARGGEGKADRGKNARQITWVLLLKAHRAAGKLTGAASAALSPSTPSSPPRDLTPRLARSLRFPTTCTRYLRGGWGWATAA
uniref:Uncharacterized protein n=1 Tax=Zea mays TaxID=4577 RepID=A0A804NCK1_MAIZE